MKTDSVIVPSERRQTQAVLSYRSYRRCRGRQARPFVIHAFDAAVLDGAHAAAIAAGNLTLGSAETAAQQLSSSATQLVTAMYSLGDAAASQDAALQVTPHNMTAPASPLDTCSIEIEDVALS